MSSCRNIKTYLIICLVLLYRINITPVYAYQGNTNDTTNLSIIFIGDVMGHDGQILAAYDATTKTYDYRSCFSYIKPYVENADIAIANLEVTLAGPPYKGYPQFSSPDELSVALRDAGFDILLTANNHSLDRSRKGLERTIKVLDKNGIIHTGTFKNKRTRDLTYPLIIEKNNILLAILNYTYGTNGIETKKPNIVNRIDTARMKKDLIRALSVRPDFVITTIHWGKEYERNANKQQKELAMFLLQNGSDIIIGSHPHVVQPVEKLYIDQADSTDYSLVVYSMGNFVSNQRSRYRDGGIAIEIQLEKTQKLACPPQPVSRQTRQVNQSGKTRIIDYNYLPVWVYHHTSSDKNDFYVVPPAAYAKDPDYFNLPLTDKTKLLEFYYDTKEHLKNIPENSFYQHYTFSTDSIIY